MAQNYISRGEVINIAPVEREYKSGAPYRINDFNGVALLSVVKGNTLSFQLEGIFEFKLEGVKVGDLIYIDKKDNLTRGNTLLSGVKQHIYGRAVVGTGSSGKFYCRLLQS